VIVPQPYGAQTSLVRYRCFRDLPKRSIFQTRIASNFLRQASDISRLSAGRDLRDLR
jgi:hypothetical protein